MTKVKTLYDDMKVIHDGGQELAVTDGDLLFQKGFSTAITILKSKEVERNQFLQDIIDGKIRGAEARRIAIQKFT